MKTIIECAIGNTLPKDAEPTETAEKYGCTACEYIRNNRVIRCSKFVYLAGKDPQTADDYINEGKCIDAWQPILQLEMANTNRGQTAALESFRNETIKQQGEFIHTLKYAALNALEQKQLRNN
jgi:hypothetical protein